MKTLRMALVAPLFAALTSFAADFQTYHVRVERLTDSRSGTFVITNLRRPEKIKVRLAGVEVQPSKEAKRFLQREVEGRTLKLTVTGVSNDGAVEGTLSYWILDQKQFVNSELVRAGFAKVRPDAAELPGEAVAALAKASTETKRVAVQ